MLGWIAAGWVLGVNAQVWSGAKPSIVALAVTFFLAGSLTKWGRELGAQLWWVPLAGFAAIAGLSVDMPPAPDCPRRGALDGSARVTRVRFGIDEADVWLALEEGRWRSTGERAAQNLPVRLRTTLDGAPPRGSVVAFSGSVRPSTRLRNPSLHPSGSAHRDDACWAKVDDGGLTVSRAPPLTPWLARARDRVRARLRTGLPGEVASVARALVLGDGSALPYERRRTIAAVGLAHLFAVSGLHIALVSGTLVGLLGWGLRGVSIGVASKRIAAALGIPLTLLHAAFAGGAPSAWRAAITAAVTWSLVALGRRSSPTAVTGIAALLLSAPDPGLAARPAFLLSIVATTAILSGQHVAQGRWRRLRSASAVSARALVATAPLVWWWFGGVPLIGWLTNILVLPLGTFAVVPLAHVYAFASDLPGIGSAARWALVQSTRFLLALCDFFAPLAVARRLPPLSTLQGIAVAFGCLAWLRVRRRRAQLAIALATALVWGAAEVGVRRQEQPRDALRATFLDVGQGDAALIDFPDGSMALIDTGAPPRHPASRAILRVLRERRRSHIDRLIITHGHPDHDGGLAAVLDEVPVHEIWLNGQRLAEEEDGALASLLRGARARGTRVRFPSDLCGTHEFGDATLEVMWPCPRYDPALDFNDNSLTLRVGYEGRTLLLVGDLEAEAEQQLIERGDLSEVTLLKVAHHGSKTSTTPEWIAATRPEFAVISAGRHNRYGHPHPGVIARLEATGTRVLRTDRHGGVVVTLSKGDVLVAPTVGQKSHISPTH
ncbi:MAG: DNA internalization-related competence protein ComEC/Rec2 [Myxococcota bacterium]